LPPSARPKGTPGIDTTKPPGDTSTENREQGIEEGIPEGNLPADKTTNDTISAIQNDISRELQNLNNAGNDLINSLNSFYSDLIDMIGKRRQELQSQYEKDRTQIDPETQMALDRLQEQAQNALKRVKEEANRRGILDSGIYYGDLSDVDKEALRQRGYIENTRLKGLRDRLQSALEMLGQQEFSLRTDQGRQGFSARQRLIDMAVEAQTRGTARLDRARERGEDRQQAEAREKSEIQRQAAQQALSAAAKRKSEQAAIYEDTLEADVVRNLYERAQGGMTREGALQLLEQNRSKWSPRIQNRVLQEINRLWPFAGGTKTDDILYGRDVP
jgi:hypothetical protein